MPNLAQKLGFLLLSFWFSIPPVFADAYALLVGVSAYPGLPEKMRLTGPRNDVETMFRGLSGLGLQQNNITILADGVTRPATRDAILKNLESILAKGKRGDWLVVYFSGHGSQQPQIKMANGYTEPDGLDEIFLPYDVARWNGQIGKVENAIVDDEFGRFIDAANKRGINVWAIFDTCHAGDMAKSFPPPGVDRQVRFVDPSYLGVPQSLLTNVARLPRKSFEKNSATKRHGGTQVTFYASQADEQAPEERLSSLLAQESRQSIRQGVFTWHLARLLPTWQGSFSELAKQIRQAYRSEQRPFPTPGFEGGLEVIPNFVDQPDRRKTSASITSLNNSR
jgi:hypothetical protein